MKPEKPGRSPLTIRFRARRRARKKVLPGELARGRAHQSTRPGTRSAPPVGRAVLDRKAGPASTRLVEGRRALTPRGFPDATGPAPTEPHLSATVPAPVPKSRLESTRPVRRNQIRMLFRHGANGRGEQPGSACPNARYAVPPRRHPLRKNAESVRSVGTGQPARLRPPIRAPEASICSPARPTPPARPALFAGAGESVPVGRLFFRGHGPRRSWFARASTQRRPVRGRSGPVQPGRRSRGPRGPRSHRTRDPYKTPARPASGTGSRHVDREPVPFRSSWGLQPSAVDRSVLIPSRYSMWGTAST